MAAGTLGPVAKPKKTAKYDLKAADRKRNLWIQIGLTAIVVLFAVGLVLYIVTQGPSKEDGRAIRVASPNVVTAEGTTDPKVVISTYEDFLCPACGTFERSMGPTISRLVDAGAVAVDYRIVAILDATGQGYSSRAGGAAYCVADESIDAFRRFHTAMYDANIQPREGGGIYPNNAQLIEYARQAGAGGSVADCINRGTYVDMVKNMASATGIRATPTVRINGEDYQWSTPEALVAKVKEIVGDLPALDNINTSDSAAPTPAPAGAPAPAPAVPATP